MHFVIFNFADLGIINKVATTLPGVPSSATGVPFFYEFYESITKFIGIKFSAKPYAWYAILMGTKSQLFHPFPTASLILQWRFVPVVFEGFGEARLGCEPHHFADF